MMPSVQDPADFPAFWADCVNRGAVDELVGLYHAKSVLMPTFSPHAAKNGEQVRAYFEQLASRAGLGVSLHDGTVDCLAVGGGGHVVSGIYSFQFEVDGTLLTFPSRFTFVIDLAQDAPILHHHSSQIPRTLS